MSELVGPRLSLLVSVTAVSLSACGGGSTSGAATATGSPSASAAASPAPSVSPAAGAATAPVVKSGPATVSGAAVTVLTDAQGQTLYYRGGDGPTTITCTGTCAANWPPILLPDGNPKAAPGIPGTLAVFTGPNGRQVLYNGHPLYLWVKDTAPGQATGQNIAGFKVVTPDIAAAG